MQAGTLRPGTQAEAWGREGRSGHTYAPGSADWVNAVSATEAGTEEEGLSLWIKIAGWVRAAVGRCLPTGQLSQGPPTTVFGNRHPKQGC